MKRDMNKLRRIFIDDTRLGEILIGLPYARRSQLATKLPPDFRLGGCYYLPEKRGFDILICSESFEPVTRGAMVPLMELEWGIS